MLTGNLCTVNDMGTMKPVSADLLEQEMENVQEEADLFETKMYEKVSKNKEKLDEERNEMWKQVVTDTEELGKKVPAYPSIYRCHLNWEIGVWGDSSFDKGTDWRSLKQLEENCREKNKFLCENAFLTGGIKQCRGYEYWTYDLSSSIPRNSSSSNVFSSSFSNTFS